MRVPVFFLRLSLVINENHSPIDSDSLSRLAPVDSSSMSTSNYTSRSRRDSPNNTLYRHSAASSIDSGRSSTALYDSPKVRRRNALKIDMSFLSFRCQMIALSSFLGIGDARSICSNESKSSDPDKTSYRSSNSSLDESSTLTLHTLLRSGVPENEIVYSWLREFSYENYAENFLLNGYDIQTIARMTPEVIIDFIRDENNL